MVTSDQLISLPSLACSFYHENISPPRPPPSRSSPLSLPPSPLPSSPPLLQEGEDIFRVSFDLKKLEWECRRIRNAVGTGDECAEKLRETV